MVAINQTLDKYSLTVYTEVAEKIIGKTTVLPAGFNLERKNMSYPPKPSSLTPVDQLPECLKDRVLCSNNQFAIGYVGCGSVVYMTGCEATRELSLETPEAIAHSNQISAVRKSVANLLSEPLTGRESKDAEGPITVDILTPKPGNWSDVVQKLDQELRAQGFSQSNR